MKVIFTQIGEYVFKGFYPALSLAHKFSGCEVNYIATRPIQGVDGFVSTRHFEGLMQRLKNWQDQWDERKVLQRGGLHMVNLNRAAVAKWFLSLAYLEMVGYSGPAFYLDWDVAVLSSLPKYLALFNGDEEIIGSKHGGLPYYFKHTSTLKEALDYWMSLPIQPPPVHDMVLFGRYYRHTGKYPADIMEERGGFIGDYNLFGEQHSDIYEVDEDRYKTLHWKDGKPHFRRRDNGRLVQCVWVHCWGKYKDKIGELAGKAGL